MPLRLSLWLLTCFPLVAQNLHIERVEAHSDKEWRLYLNLSSPTEQKQFVKTNQFELRIGQVWTGAPNQVETFERSSEPMAVALVVDASGTMKGVPLNEAKIALTHFLETLKANDAVALLSFNDTVQVQTPFSTNKIQVASLVEALEVGGRSSVLYKAIFKALQLLDNPSLPKRRLLVVLSDGKDEGVAYTDQDVITRAKKLGIPIFALGYSKVDQVYLNNLERMAELTGGLFDSTHETNHLDQMFQGLQAHLNAQLILHFQPDPHIVLKRIEEIEVKCTIGDHSVSETAEVLIPQDWGSVTEVEEIEPSKSPAWWIMLSLVLLAAICALLFIFKRKGSKETEDAQETAQFEPVGSTKFAEPCEARASAVFMVRSPYQEGSFLIHLPEIWIGGNEACSIILKDKQTSNYHAVLRWQGEAFTLWDNQSTNGTIVDNCLIHGATQLKSGSVVKIGQTLLAFHGLRNS